MLKFKKVAICGMTGVPDATLQSYKKMVEERCEGAELDIITKNILSESDLTNKLKGYDILMSGFQPVSDNAYEELNLAAYIACSIGYEFTNPKGATKAGTVVTNNPTYCTTEVAEHTVSLILACARSLFKMGTAVRDGKWGFPIAAPQFQFKGSTVGLYGFGHIPRMVAQKLKGFEVEIIASDPFVKQEQVSDLGVTIVPFDELVESADYISLHAPLLPSTEGVFDAAIFKKMKKTASIINTARGPLIKQDDLYRALVDGEIKMAALDVLIHEPPKEEDMKLLELPNVICTGHSAFYSEDSLKNQTELTVQNICRVLRGELPENIVNRDVIDKLDWAN